MYLSGGLCTQGASVPSGLEPQYAECTFLVGYSRGQKKPTKNLIFFSICIIGYSVSNVILRYNRRVCVKSGVKQMSVSVGISKSWDFKSLGERKYRCKIEIKKQYCSPRMSFIFKNRYM